MITATQIRKNIFLYLNDIEKSNTPIRFSRKGKVFVIVPEISIQQGRLYNLKERKIINGDDILENISWEDEWSAGKDL